VSLVRDSGVAWANPSRFRVSTPSLPRGVASRWHQCDSRLSTDDTNGLDRAGRVTARAETPPADVAQAAVESYQLPPYDRHYGLYSLPDPTLTQSPTSRLTAGLGRSRRSSSGRASFSRGHQSERARTFESSAGGSARTICRDDCRRRGSSSAPVLTSFGAAGGVVHVRFGKPVSGGPLWGRCRERDRQYGAPSKGRSGAGARPDAVPRFAVIDTPRRSLCHAARGQPRGGRGFGYGVMTSGSS
jgi:hypothetical protein